MEIKKLRHELKDYYRAHSCSQYNDNRQGGFTYRHPIHDRLDRYAAEHPDSSALRLKTAQYEIIAEHFQPVIFANSPFYSEMGIKVSEYDGVPGLGVGGWLFKRNEHVFRDVDPVELERYEACSKHGIHLVYGPYADYDHHCFPYTNVIENGLGGLYKQAEAELAKCKDAQEQEFIECALRSLLAVKKIAGKFAAAATAVLENATDDESTRFLSMIAETAGEVPWRKPETFYEVLCALWFLHEVCASIEGVGMSVIGRLDRMAGEFYCRDLEAGRLTREEAYDLLARFMIYTDCKLDFNKPVEESYNRQEQGDTLILGGCSDDDSEIFNDVTQMVLDIHHELDLIYPKIHCRITPDSNQTFLDAINRDFAAGRNVISFLNDTSIIPAQVKAGKKREDARRYVAGGCWEIIVEGYEHSAGANCYLNLAKIMDMSIHDQPKTAIETGIACTKMDDADSFDDVYRIVMDNIIRALRKMCATIAKGGSLWPEVNPSPFFSACLYDCLKNHTDYTAGGGRYNPHALPLAGLSILVDSLLAIRTLCFEKKHCSLTDLLQAVRANWEGFEPLRAEALLSPHFGDNSPKSNQLAAQILNELYEKTRDLKNERGGPFQLGLYNYRDIVDWAPLTLGTPDGRRQGDFLTQGLTPSRLHPSAEITATMNSCAALDLSGYPACSVLTISLPLGGVDAQILSSLERVFAHSGIAMLQLNCVDQQQLLDAREHPDRHRDLIVRLYGYSARFVNLTPEMQDEFISRNIYAESRL